MTRFESVIPILSVKNVPASLRYYTEELGFSKAWDWADPPSFACVSRDDARFGNPATRLRP